MRRVQSIHTTSAKRETIRKSNRISNLRNVSSQNHTIHLLFIIGVYTEDQFLCTQKKPKELINNALHFIPSYNSNFYTCKTRPHKVKKKKIPY